MISGAQRKRRALNDERRVDWYVQTDGSRALLLAAEDCTFGFR